MYFIEIKYTMNGFYINLEKRNDRNEHMQKLIKDFPFFKDIKRMNAYYSNKYGVGCTQSHINCLTECLKMNEEYYLIMEDDFFIFNKKNFIRFKENFDKIKCDNDWDVITLTPHGNTTNKNYKENFNKIINSQTTTAYIIKHDFINQLLKYMQIGLKGLKKGYIGPEPNPYCTDQCWKPLQKKSNWIYHSEIFAGQIPSYSDIEGRFVNYNKAFLNQINK